MSADDLNLSFDPRPEENDALELQDDLEPHGAEEPSASRPAEGARHATPGEVLFEGFSGSEDAGDFLGLDTELHFSSDMGSHGHVDTGFGGGSELDLQAAPGAPTPVADEAYYDEDGGAPEGDYAPEDEDGVYAEGEYEDEDPRGYEAYDEEEYAAAAAGPHRGVLLVSALFVGALVVAGATYGPGLVERFTGGPEPTTVATTSTGTGSATTSAETDAAPTGAEGTVVFSEEAGIEADPTTPSTTDDPFFASAEGVPTPVRTGERGSLQRLFSSPTFTLSPRDPARTSTAGDGLARTGTTPSVATGPTVSDEPTRAFDVPPERAIQLPGVTRDDDAGVEADYLVGGLGDWASAGDVDVVWRRSEIPLEAMDAPTRVATPRVGTVRVHLAGGDFFEGRLVALGEGHVWIQTKPGRMSFPGEQVESIEALGMELAVADPGAIHAPMRGERVRVRAPGGIIYGHVVAQDEAGVLTLRTDEGGKVTLIEAEVEAIGSARAVIVER